MSNQINIYLTPLDKVEDSIKRATRVVANYFKENETSIVLSDFCEILKRSAKWNIGNIETEYIKVQNDLEQTYKNANIFIHKLTRGEVLTAFKMADKKGKNFLDSLRGRLFEAILVGLYGGTYLLETPRKPEQRGWGVSVGLPTKSASDVIAYIDPSGDKDKSKKTMDYVYIKENNRVFYECKIQPDRFGETEIKYFTLFHKKFNELMLDHELCFFAADCIDEIEMELADYDLNFPLNALGYDNAASFIEGKL